MNELHFAPGACSFVPHVALELVRAATGEDFAPRLVKLHKGEHLTPEYLALNPDGQVPLLVADGRPLSQVVAICDWLDRQYPAAGLLPADPWTRAQAMSVLAWMNNTVHPTFTHVFMPHKFADGELSHAELKRFNAERYRSLLERIQSLVERGAPWLFGERVGVVDAYALTLLRWGGMAKIDPDSLPAYKAYVDRLAATPAVAAALERERLPLHTFKKD
ncbi:glutathione S-transferase family protein [Quisquiliibacterium transsilvanicum]|uniref:Glutathione S-transferase n=1 Tax=Quisquiliibacterium transsilvanicum TaxID=1549638 RepID=A0A7W8HI62_9BURK|nr:glutathione S-transferase family protein [Quisquiliibacterium transsilvanicum]MBB5272509.1 glutathione S-transferase [Quisquiliibacterium transsilvanicum]